MASEAQIRQRLAQLGLGLGILVIFTVGLAFTRPVVASTDTMVPAFSRGDAAITTIVAASEVRVGDVIAREVRPGSDATVTHRVTSIGRQNGRPVFTTQGDATTNPDPVPSVADGSVQRVVRVIPFTGWPVLVLGSSPWVPLGVVAVPALLLLASVARRSHRPQWPVVGTT